MTRSSSSSAVVETLRSRFLETTNSLKRILIDWKEASEAPASARLDLTPEEHRPATITAPKLTSDR
ncbi:hypothetical protein FRB95_008261 [Tulasnella sp. JGI-2019a]|nr:hypothetical protein FRB95_008261 [Tulasnella sp. JGI-2019a]